MKSEDVTYPRGGDTLKAYAARPDGTTDLGAVIVIPDVRGLTEHYRDIARRFAGEGFFALAVDLYSREGPPELADMAAVTRWIRQLPDPRVLADLGAAVAFLGRRPETAHRPVGITGLLHGRAVRPDGGVQRAGARCLRVLVRYAALRRA